MLQAATSASNLRELKAQSAGSGLALKAPPFFVQMAESMGVDQKELWVVLKNTAFKGELKRKKINGEWTTVATPVSDEQMYALMMVANAYGLNPFTKEIYAFPDKQNGIVPVVGVDGWLRIANSHPMMDGYEVRASKNLVKIDDDAKECPEWMEGIVYRRDRAHPVVVREYLDECYRPAFEGEKEGKAWKTTGPWQSHTKRMLRHKALIQAFRTAFGFAGVYEEDEAQRIIESKVIDTTPMLEQGPDTSEFDRLAADVANDPQFIKFVSEAAQANGMTTDELKAEAARSFDEFVASFHAWANTQQPPTGRSVNRPTKEEMAARREETRAELERLGVLEQVTKAMGDKGMGSPATWNTGQCNKALEIGREIAAAQQQTAPQAQDAPPVTVSCPNRLDSDNNPATVLRTECDSCKDYDQCWGAE